MLVGSHREPRSRVLCIGQNVSRWKTTPVRPSALCPWDCFPFRPLHGDGPDSIVPILSNPVWLETMIEQNGSPLNCVDLEDHCSGKEQVMEICKYYVKLKAICKAKSYTWSTNQLGHLFWPIDSHKWSVRSGVA